MVVSSNPSTKRLSSLEAAGVRSSSSTTTSTSTTTTKKRVSATTLPTTRTVRSSITPGSPTVPKRPTKTPLKQTSTVKSTSTAKPVSTVKPASTVKPVSTVKPASISTAKPVSKASISNVPLTPVPKKKPVSLGTTTPRSPSRASSRATTPSSGTLGKVVEPSVTTDKMQSELNELQVQLEEKDICLNELKIQLEIMMEENKLLQERKDDQAVTCDEELLKTIQLLQNQSIELNESFDLERLDLVQKYETAELKNRESMERLREKVEIEKGVLNGNLLDKERDIEKLKKDMDELRDNIKEMHQSHQTRLTTLTNQLNQQYMESMDKLRLSHQDEKLKYENELEKTNTELKLLKLQSVTENNQNASDLEKEFRKLKESDMVYLAELDQCKLELKATESKLQVMQDIIKERPDQSDLTLLQDQHVTLIKELKESHDKQVKEIITRLEKDCLDKLELKDEQIESQQNQISELKKYEVQVVELNKIISTLQNQHSLLKQDIQEQSKKNDKLNTEYVLELEKNQELETKYNNMETTLTNVESTLSQKESVIAKLEKDQDKAIKQIKDQHAIILEELKITHRKELEHAESENLSCVQSTRVKTEAYESRIQKLQINEQCLKEELFKLKNQLQTNQLEMELKLAEKLKLAELKLSQKYQVLQEELEVETKKNHDRLELELKSCQDEYKQLIESNQSNANNDELKTVRTFYENALSCKEKELKQVKDQLKIKMNDATQVIIEQHQKELNVLQNQFQNLIDMKDTELNDLLYGMKSKKEKSTSKKIENEKMEIELKKQLYSLEEKIKSKSLEMRWLETDSEQNETKLKEQAILIHNLQLNNSKLENSIQQFKDENDQMLRLIHQLQGEIHQF